MYHVSKTIRKLIIFVKRILNLLITIIINAFTRIFYLEWAEERNERKVRNIFHSLFSEIFPQVEI